MLLSKKKKILSAFLSLAMIGTVVASVPLSASATTTSAVSVTYSAYQSKGWHTALNNVAVGKANKSLSVEALKVSLTGLPKNASISYQVYENKGWHTAKDGIAVGNANKKLAIEALKISLNGVTGYSVTYSVYENKAWHTAKDGIAVGNANKDYKIEAIEINIVKTPVITNTVANVSTAAELTSALANSSVNTINLASSLTDSPTITRPITMNFGAFTLTGNVSFDYTGKGTSVLTGNSGNRIIGNLTVNTANASFNNGVKVSGTVNVANVEIGTWVESADGNTLTVTDPDGAVITVTGHPDAINISSTASGSLVLNVSPNATINSITSDAPITIAVAAGATVTNITAAVGSSGSTITNNGNTGTVTADVPINLVANVAPTNTITAGSGNITVSGTAAGSVTVKPAPIDKTAYNAALAAVTSADYTTATWATYQGIVAANVVTDQDTQAAVDASTAAITAAQASLVKVAILTVYNAALAAVTVADYTTTTWATYQGVVAANVVTAQGTQLAVDSATAAITAAQASLVKVANLTTYNAALAAVNSADYTTATWATYQGVIAANVETAQGTQSAVDASTAAITAAQASLVKVANLTAYNAALAAVNSADYTTTTWTTYQGVVVANVVTAQDTQTVVDASTAAITTGQASLVKVADLTAYNAALAAVNSANYTTATWATYQGVVAANVVTAQDTQTVVDAATLVITTAQASLVKVADLTAYSAALAAVTMTDYSEESWATYQGVVTSNLVTAQDTQLSVDAATAAITAAQVNLVHN